jgi:hypothetical protein
VVSPLQLIFIRARGRLFEYGQAVFLGSGRPTLSPGSKDRLEALDVLDMLTVLLISLPVGFVGSLTGIGGASVLVPILVGFGFPVKEAIAAGMVTVIATSSGSAIPFVSGEITNVKVAMFLEVFTIIGAIVGATITILIAPVFLYFFFAAFLATSFLSPKEFGSRPYESPKEQDVVSRWLALDGSYYDESLGRIIDYRVTNALVGGVGMFGAGVAAGMLGIGAGAFKVTVQQHILKMPTKVSSTTSNFIIGVTALAGTSVYLFSGLMNVSLMAPMAVGTTIGAVVGGAVLNRLTNRTLNLLFLFIVAVLMIQMLYKGFSSL